MTKLLIIGGFLGSGKTSVILQLAKYLVGPEPASHAKVIVLENEIGTVSIDDKTLASTLHHRPLRAGVDYPGDDRHGLSQQRQKDDA